MIVDTSRTAAFLRSDVTGAPLRIGQQVVITAFSADETIDCRFLGCHGVVRGLLYDDPSQLPRDPLVLVEVAGLGEEWFFVRELRAQAVAARELATFATA